eukprot:358174-Chlamydomonas_euryale.AAC.1
MPQLPRGALSQVDKAVARGQRSMRQKIFKSLDHTHFTHRCCRSCVKIYVLACARIVACGQCIML